MDDQHRFDYLGSAGAGFINTPSLDYLAGKGMRFTQCCTNSPVCAPARIGLATGLQPSRMGVTSNRSFLPQSVSTYYQRLRDHGYRVGCVGKLDLAKPDPYNGRNGDRPCVFGFGFTHPEECEGKMHAGSSPTPIGPYTHYLYERGLLQAFHEDYRIRKAKGWVKDASHDSVLPADAFEDAYIGRRAAEWIENIPMDFPWHLFVSFAGPHDPFDPPTEYADRYRKVKMPEPIHDSMEKKPARVRNRVGAMEQEEIAIARRQYCAAIELIDDQAGLILEALEHRGIRDHTYVIFASDHGEMIGDHGLFNKHVAYEPALRVPLIMAGPGIRGNYVSDALVELIDLNPTICDLAGLPVQENIDALSIWPILRGQREVHRTETIATEEGYRCLRTAEYKYTETIGDLTELYNLKSDPDELNNIAEDEPEVVHTLSRRMKERLIEGKWLR